MNDMATVLPTIVRKNGHDYFQIRNGQRTYLFQQKVGNRIVGFEVFLKIVKPQRQVNGIDLPELEKFPHNEGFGIWAWSFYTLEKALLKFNKLDGICEEQTFRVEHAK